MIYVIIQIFDKKFRLTLLVELQKKIGMTRFELAAPATRTRCATRLRYIPKFYYLLFEFKSTVNNLSGISLNSNALPEPLEKPDI